MICQNSTRGTGTGPSAADTHATLYYREIASISRNVRTGVAARAVNLMLHRRSSGRSAGILGWRTLCLLVRSPAHLPRCVPVSVKQSLRRLVEKAFNVQVTPVGQLALAFEWEHLRRFFAHFAVDCVFDVGANAGQYAKRLRTRVGYAGPIVSYEPIPELAAKIRTAAALERAWFVEELALDATENHATLNIFESNPFSSLHSASETAEQEFPKQLRLERRIEVNTATLASELGKYQAKLRFKRPFLKMDTQGHDLSVAIGAGDRLRDFVGLQSELAIQRLYADSPSYEEALEFYRRSGFELSALVPNNLGHFPRLLEIDCIMFRA